MVFNICLFFPFIDITVEQVLPDALLLSSPSSAVTTLPAKEQINICISNVGTLKTGTYSVNIPPLIHPKWDQHFEIDWSYLPRSIAECLNKGKRLDPRDKREFVRFVSRSITDVCPKPKRRNLVNIIEKIVDTFPKSLADTWCAETAGNGYESLLRKVITRIENLNRNPSSHRFSRTSGEKKKRHPGYKTYGCSNFEPEIIEDEDDLERKKEVMKEMYANGNRDVSVIVKTLLKQTYKLQRREINQGRDINQLIADWPYLFTFEGLLVHFIELVGIDIRSKLGNVLGMKGSSIIAFMSKFTEKCYKKEKLKNTLFELLSSGVKIEDELISDMSGILMLIMQYFEETKESLYMIIENAVPSNEVESIINMQEISSPLIVIQGQSEFSYDSCMLYAKGKIVMEGIKTFKDAFICLFCSYYCLNIDYPLSAAATLEFIQRCFFGINPDYGGKVQKRMKWRMNTKVTKLIEMLSEYDPGCANF